MQDTLWLAMWNIRKNNFVELKEVRVLNYNDNKDKYTIEKVDGIYPRILGSNFGNVSSSDSLFGNKFSYLIAKTKEDAVKYFNEYKNKRIEGYKKTINTWENMKI